MFIYPISIVLILLNLFDDDWASKRIHRVVVLTAFVFSIPDFLQFFVKAEQLQPFVDAIPLASYNMGWVLPSVIVFFLMNLINRLSPKT